MGSPKSGSQDLARTFVLCPPERITTVSLSGRRQKDKEGKGATAIHFIVPSILPMKAAFQGPMALKFQHEGSCFKGFWCVGGWVSGLVGGLVD